MSIKKPAFDPTITWGHVMQAVVMLVALVGLYADARIYKTKTEARIERLEEHDKAHHGEVANAVLATQRLSEAVTRLSVVVEERTGERLFRVEPKRGALERMP